MVNLEKRGIITLAVGKKFVNQAKYLAYSCMLHCPEILRAIITDRNDDIKNLYDFIIPYDKNADPFETKLLLNHYTPFQETLFLDSDTLVYGNIGYLFEYLNDQSFIYVGQCRTDGYWCYDIKSTAAKFNIPWIGQLNSGIFLFKNDETSSNIFEFAHSLHEDVNELNISFFRRSMYSDEPFFGIAFGKYLQKPIENDHGRIGRTIINKKHIRVNIIRGYASFIWKNKILFLAVVHFCDHAGLYLREKIKLFLYIKTPLNYFTIAFIANFVKIFYQIFVSFIGKTAKRVIMKIYKILKNTSQKSTCPTDYQINS
jgi:hypothetical protein